MNVSMTLLYSGLFLYKLESPGMISRMSVVALERLSLIDY